MSSRLSLMMPHLPYFGKAPPPTKTYLYFHMRLPSTNLLNNVLWMSSPGTFHGRMFDLNLATFSKEDREAMIAAIKSHRDIRVIRDTSTKLRVAI